jgi:signal transduction histidine kinase
LVLVVVDDGAGLSPNHAPVEGIGLTNTRERLRASYPSDAKLTLEPGDTGGVVARIDVPFRALPPGKA